MAHVKVFFKVPCPYCVNAKRLLTEKKVNFEEIDLTEKPEEFDRLKNETGYRTVPMIFIDGKLIGGYSDLRALEDEGRLDSVLGL